MSYDKSMFSSGSSIGTQIVTNSIINVTQDISQGLIDYQKLYVNCSKKNTITCKNCIKTYTNDLSSLINDPNLKDVCPSCFCLMENINMDKIINLNLSTLQSSSQMVNFSNQINNSIKELATLSGSSLSKNYDPKQFVQVSNKIFAQFKSNTFQTAINQLKNYQEINIKSPNTNIINVKLKVAINYISNILQQNNELSDSINDLDNQVTQILQLTYTSIFQTLISWVITIIIIIITALIFIFMIPITLQSISAYVSV